MWAPNVGIDKHLCMAQLLQRAWLHSGKVSLSRAASVPSLPEWLFLSQKQHQVANKRQLGSPAPLHGSPAWLFLLHPCWHRFRGFCAEQTGLLRLPLSGHLREGIVWLMRWEEKIKLPRCLSFGIMKKKSPLIFGNWRVFTARCSQREERKCGGWVPKALCFRQSPLPELGAPQPSSPAECGCRGPTGHCNHRAIGQRPHGGKGGPASSILRISPSFLWCLVQVNEVLCLMGKAKCLLDPKRTSGV